MSAAVLRKSQSSRKGKKAWRKNVDVSQIEEGLHEKREEERIVGTTIDALSSDQLFTVDTSVSKSAQKKVGKPLKVDQILAERSAIPAVIARKRAASAAADKEKKRGKVQGVTYKELGRLLRVAGRVTNAKSSVALIEAESREIKDVYDAWADDEPSKNPISKNNLVENAESINLSHTISFASAQYEPDTIKRSRLKFKDSNRGVDLPNPGQSYNPSLESWQKLLSEENKKLEKDERERLKEEARLERIQKLGELLDARAAAGLDEVDSEEEEEVEEKVEIKSEAKEGDTELLSNVPIISTVDSKDGIIDISKSKKNVRKQKYGKHKIAKRPLEVKLSDELNDSLRLIKPEGNLAKDRFISFQERGIIESRVQVMPGRKYKKQVTEKWSYKNIK
ncbi:ribosome biogenesis protein Nop53/GLTSCR2 [Lipomyces japonicus]|uniref:ribosome biogenesis protein Nop53/GLTSCR2 n=1 Tax=Lipomyces japonicus TaxID=56871 RepID=UPI0034CF0D3D